VSDVEYFFKFMIVVNVMCDTDVSIRGAS